ncbi:hypothetical protein GCM10027427_09880 [Pseudoclavibacter terrae]
MQWDPVVDGELGGDGRPGEVRVESVQVVAAHARCATGHDERSDGRPEVLGDDGEVRDVVGHEGRVSPWRQDVVGAVDDDPDLCGSRRPVVGSGTPHGASERRDVLGEVVARDGAPNQDDRRAPRSTPRGSRCASARRGRRHLEQRADGVQQVAHFGTAQPESGATRLELLERALLTQRFEEALGSRGRCVDDRASGDPAELERRGGAPHDRYAGRQSEVHAEIMLELAGPRRSSPQGSCGAAGGSSPAAAAAS